MKFYNMHLFFFLYLVYFNANRDAQEENRVALSEDIIFSNTVEGK